MYLNETKNKVVDFLKERRTVLQTELQFLGNKSMQISYKTLAEILDDLVKEKKVVKNHISIGKKEFIEITWKGG